MQASDIAGIWCNIFGDRCLKSGVIQLDVGQAVQNFGPKKHHQKPGEQRKQRHVQDDAQSSGCLPCTACSFFGFSFAHRDKVNRRVEACNNVLCRHHAPGQDTLIERGKCFALTYCQVLKVKSPVFRTFRQSHRKGDINSLKRNGQRDFTLKVDVFVIAPHTDQRPALHSVALPILTLQLQGGSDRIGQIWLWTFVTNVHRNLLRSNRIGLNISGSV